MHHYKKYHKTGEARNIENYKNPIVQQPQYERKFESGKEGKLPFYCETYKFSIYKLVPSILKEETKDMVLAFLKLLEYPNYYTSGNSERFVENKENQIRQYITKYSGIETYNDM